MLPFDPKNLKNEAPGDLDEETVDRIVEMAWEDRTPFEAIEMQYGIKENQVRAIMRKHMKRSSFHMWRKRVKGRATKHGSTRTEGIKRFKSQNQKGRIRIKSASKKRAPALQKRAVQNPLLVPL